ncbi:MAG: pyridoxamine 5'-phosphate oxidase family protein [Paracoccus sp. (in: a-proteobacteria)]|uniref:pyridoxamine 5'-phosphate oxidase family protein n=1 Tax=Paracoccus sp. TaxID=267 RepID=UPI0026E063DA|nr:pyridoxamine 5'-phosphate oxidase family protein [Paracoccus sp. (in: a-proteobacteria)]MDO5633157.1 pyridoxamine 5'-phosphate oxidase family protein [Paracoccus sp. (in: a-proteobacteria)]
MNDAPDRLILCWLATVDGRGRPNVSPKEIHARLDPNLYVIADIASARSVRNIRENPAVCVSMIDIFRQRGQKLEGAVTIIPASDPDFPTMAAPLEEMTGGLFPIRHVICVQIARVSPILAPSYSFFPNRSEADLIRDAHRSYGVRPLPDADL